MTTATHNQPKRWTEIAAIWKDNRWLYALAGILLGLLATPAVEQITGNLNNLIGNLVPEAVGIVFTVLILDRLADNRAKEERKLTLFTQAKSRSNDFAMDAMSQIQHENLWDELIGYHRNSDGQVDLTAIQWAGGVNLEKSNLYQFILRGADLQEGFLRSANLRNADLKLANLQNASIGLANLQDAKLVGAKLQKAHLVESNLQDANLQLADLQEADLGSANLQNANLEFTNLQESSLGWVNLSRARLWGANIKKANLYAANLQDTYLLHANLTNSNLLKTNLRGAFLRTANLQEAKAQFADFQNANLELTNLQGVDFLRANLQETYLGSANLQEASLIGANLREAKDIDEAYFDEKTILPDAKWLDTDEKHNIIYDKYWTPETDMTRYTDPNHPDFWEPDWVKEQREADEQK